jgi:hypothetical protein
MDFTREASLAAGLADVGSETCCGLVSGAAMNGTTYWDFSGFSLDAFLVVVVSITTLPVELLVRINDKEASRLRS